jgi:hypothetical protein
MIELQELHAASKKLRLMNAKQNWLSTAEALPAAYSPVSKATIGSEVSTAHTRQKGIAREREAH